MDIKPQIEAIYHVIDFSLMWCFRANAKITFISLKSQLIGGRPQEEEEGEKKKEEGKEAKMRK